MGEKACWRCERSNQDVYRYCLGCGADLQAQTQERKRVLHHDTLVDGLNLGTTDEPNKVSTMQEYLRSRKVFFPWTCLECGTDNDSFQLRCSKCDIRRDDARVAARARAAARLGQSQGPEPDYGLGTTLLEGGRGELRVGMQMSIGRRVLVCLFRSGVDPGRLREHATKLAVLTGRSAVAVDVGTRANTDDHFLAVDLSPDADGEALGPLLAPFWDQVLSEPQLHSLAEEYHRASAEFIADEP
jgi:hypothetical protein